MTHFDPQHAKYLKIVSELEKRGVKLLGAGQAGSTFQSKNTNQVIKIFGQDECYTNYLHVIANHKNKHFPHIISLAQMQKGPYKGLFFVKMEKLYPLTTNEYKANTDFIQMKKHISQNHFKPENMEKEQPDLYNAMLLIKQGRKGLCSFDIHPQNIMKRQNGDWVIIDPYFY